MLFRSAETETLPAAAVLVSAASLEAASLEAASLEATSLEEAASLEAAGSLELLAPQPAKTPASIAQLSSAEIAF